MSSSTVTYTSVSSDSELPSWGIPLMDAGELPEMDPYVEAAQQGQAVPLLSPAYVPDPEELEHHIPVYVPKLVYPEYLAPSDNDIPVEDRPLPADVSPTTLSPGYAANSDPKEDPKEDPANYPVNGDDEEEEPSGDTNDDDVEEDEETKPFETDESAATPSPPRTPQTIVPFSQTRLRRTTRMSVRPHTLPSPSTEARIAEYTIAPTPPLLPPSPLSPWSSPLPHIPLPPLHVPSPPLPLPSPTHTSSTYAEAPLGYKAVRIWKRARFTTPTGRIEVGESSITAARQPRSTMAPMATIELVNLRVSHQADVRKQESEEFYTRHQDEQYDHAALRDKVCTLRRYLSSLCTTHEQERVEARQAFDRSEVHNRALEAQIAVLETQAYRHEWQRQDADDRATKHIMRIQLLEAGARVDILEDTGSSSA
ncbi:hypothetical protein Tco_1562735 [Tanacetum coccineum]